jgi:pyridoxine/pyridoxamine 5'-phosphate oxidase
MIAAMTRRGHDPIAKFIRWLEDARRARIPNYEAIALATAARSGKISVRFVLLKRERFELQTLVRSSMSPDSANQPSEPREPERSEEEPNP